MKKRYFWGCESKNNQKTIHRFDYQINLHSWLRGSEWKTNGLRFQLPAASPEVRRIQRRIAAGEIPDFPVEVD